MFHSSSLCVIFLVLVGLQAQAQNRFSITGSVKDSQTNEPLPTVSVQVKGTKAGTLSDADGRFMLNSVPAGNVKLRFSSVGYRTVEQSVVVTSDIANLTIELMAEQTELQTLEVSGTTEERAEEKKIRNNVMPVTIITAKQIENRAGNLNEVLARQAGVQIRMSGGLGSDSRISVRGLEGRRVYETQIN